MKKHLNALAIGAAILIPGLLMMSCFVYCVVTFPIYVGGTLISIIVLGCCYLIGSLYLTL